MALTNNQLHVARLLIEAGADVNAADWYGRTPLWSAIDVRNQEVNDGRRDNGVDRAAALQLIDALLQRGANPNSRIQQVTPVRMHVLTLGAFTWVDFTGETPFIRAATAGDVTVMKRLLARGADPRLFNPAGDQRTDGRRRHQLGGIPDLDGGARRAAGRRQAVRRNWGLM
jgi:ankyrin repeat protein